ncbi:Megakaryocyte and platelet inhibitory receptor G6b [Camelus dromedarius]|uniref:Megakaryocyte and platelet inhibitory receptor G6b n=1 Tax=Camelus dromedarius TaxID=9838 RepID=A0A5N4CSX5_CAMDR|nr:Megakaryocyte and platelet inhibitory receptor G6b [Camelus dromedarius]
MWGLLWGPLPDPIGAPVPAGGDSFLPFYCPIKPKARGIKGWQSRAREGGGREGEALWTQADTMNPLFVGILLSTLLGAALGNRMRCYDCGGGPSGSCQETVTTCGEGERCGFLERKPKGDVGQTKLSGNRTEQPFASRLRALDLDIRRLELLLSTGDSGTFICKGQHQGESRTVLHVLGDLANCRAPEPTQVPLVKAEPQRPVEEEEPKISGGLDQESSLLYADLDHMALRRPCRLSPVAPADASTIYAVVV